MQGHKHAHLINFEEREKLLPSYPILNHFGLKKGAIFADLGCGYGYFSLRAAEIVGPDGRIEAIDIEPERLEFLKKRAEERGLSDRIHIHQAQGETIPLSTASADMAFLSTVLHELNDPESYLREIQRILKIGGSIAVIEWQPKEMNMGPPMHERKPAEAWASMLSQAGFIKVKFMLHEPGHVFISGEAPSL